MSQPALFAGIDVQESRGCAWALLDDHGRALDRGWATGDTREVTASIARAFARAEADHAATVHVGIDAPRAPLLTPRAHYWDGPRRQWRARRAGDRGYGRHAEIVVAALALARPQWTPFAAEAPAWMQLGFALFEALAHPRRRVFEVFPSAALTQLDADSGLEVTLAFAGFRRGAKDMLDAHVAAAVVREVVQGRGAEVGGGDGLGTIALPRPVDARASAAVLTWPCASG